MQAFKNTFEEQLPETCFVDDEDCCTLRRWKHDDKVEWIPPPPIESVWAFVAALTSKVHDCFGNFPHELTMAGKLADVNETKSEMENDHEKRWRQQNAHKCEIVRDTAPVLFYFRFSERICRHNQGEPHVRRGKALKELSERRKIVLRCNEILRYAFHASIINAVALFRLRLPSLTLFPTAPQIICCAMFMKTRTASEDFLAGFRRIGRYGSEVNRIPRALLQNFTKESPHENLILNFAFCQFSDECKRGRSALTENG